MPSRANGCRRAWFWLGVADRGYTFLVQPETIAGRYRVQYAVGRGGMGTVWLCIDETLHRQVAVKQVGTLPGESPEDTPHTARGLAVGRAQPQEFCGDL